MFPTEFEYAAPTTVAEALQLLQDNPDAKVLAGGHSLLPAMKLRLAAPSMLVDIGKIVELQQISANGSVQIGATATYYQIMQHEDVAARVPLLRDCLMQVGDPQVRNKGTLGGSLAHADPSADLPAVALALGAQMQIVGLQGERTVQADDFFVDMLQSALEEGELLTTITIPAMDGKVGMAYEKFAHPASGYAVVGVAAVVRRNDDGSVADCRIAVTGAGPKVQRAMAAEAALKNGASAADAAAQASDGLEFIGDYFAAEDYRAHLAKVLTKRAVERALEQAG